MDEVGIEEPLVALKSDRDLLAYPIHFELLEGGRASDGSDESRRLHDKILASVRGGDLSGTLSQSHQSALWAFRSLPNNRVAVASIERRNIPVRASSMLPGLCFVLLLSIVCAFMVASLISKDLCHSISMLRVSAETMAGGDLQRGRIYESEDELGFVGGARFRWLG